MRRVPSSPYELAQRFVGLKEVSGNMANPQIMAMLQLDADWPRDDSVPWCSAFVNYIAWLMRLPRSKSLRARSWLAVGEPMKLDYAEPGFDVVILHRGKKWYGPEVMDAPGHVGFYAGWDGNKILVLGGNQSDSVSLSSYDHAGLLGIRRLM